jgi:hypothetical protein
MHRELSWFLIAYLLMILGVLLGVHLLQPAGDRPNGGSRSWTHQQRQTALEQAVKIPGSIRPESH